MIIFILTWTGRSIRFVWRLIYLTIRFIWWLVLPPLRVVGKFFQHIGRIVLIPIIPMIRYLSRRNETFYPAVGVFYILFYTWVIMVIRLYMGW